jgi:hypothetical protein
MSVVDEIRKLSELHKEGLLTEAEFAAEKAKLLAGGTPVAPQPLSKPEVAAEVVFLDKGDVFVSSHRLRIGGHTFATQNISSVAVTQNDEEREIHRRLHEGKATEQKVSGGCMLFVMAPVMVWIAVSWSGTFMWVLGLLTLAGGAYFFFNPYKAKPFDDEYYVEIQGGGSKTKALTCYDYSEAAVIVEACQQAITHRI